MDPIQAAIEEIESRDEGEHFTYSEVARRYGVDRRTLARRHQGKTQPRELAHLSLHPQQETELIQYIKRLTERRLPPTITMIRSFASSLAGKEVSETWLSRFLNRNSSHLISRWQTAMDRKRHKADSGAKYSLYFKLLHDKMKEYELQPTQIYTMNEKGFQIGTLGRSKRVFDKVLYNQKGITAALQDGSTEWITVLACVCSDGTALSPSLIFQSTAGALQSSWVDAIDPEKHSVFVSSSPTGWTNNDIGLAWVKEVFDRETRRKARSGYRLLLLDGHGSHLTMDFINYCDANKILLAVFPPHATHTLQPLDVALFKPLSEAYSAELSKYLQNSQGLLPITKGDFFPLFWSAWHTAFKPQTIRRSFEATGIYPPNANVILKKYHKEASSSDESSASCLSGEDWLKLKTIIRRIVKEQGSKDVKKLRRSLHHISAQNSILRGEIRGLRDSLMIKKRQDKKSFTLQLSKPQGYHGGALFYSPKTCRQARDDEMGRQRVAQQEQAQKAERDHLKEQARLYRLRLAEEKRVERERLKEVREKERAAKEAEKERQKALRDAQKAIQLSQKET
ncbi:hypothetical protein G6011_04093 [Alternaria panax]|uniref:HTH CENPB-type domain-containing protein n=1 Tax=Alternaria panax TaxID=48097 RepID=A0AAD4IFW6_9PLEO|nr:hypothetical protein G6011_04093 [Alternaria panax]